MLQVVVIGQSKRFAAAESRPKSQTWRAAESFHARYVRELLERKAPEDLSAAIQQSLHWRALRDLVDLNASEARLAAERRQRQWQSGIFDARKFPRLALVGAGLAALQTHLQSLATAIGSTTSLEPPPSEWLHQLNPLMPSGDKLQQLVERRLRATGESDTAPTRQRLEGELRDWSLALFVRTASRMLLSAGEVQRRTGGERLTLLDETTAQLADLLSSQPASDSVAEQQWHSRLQQYLGQLQQALQQVRAHFETTAEGTRALERAQVAAELQAEEPTHEQVEEALPGDPKAERRLDSHGREVNRQTILRDLQQSQQRFTGERVRGCGLCRMQRRGGPSKQIDPMNVHFLLQYMTEAGMIKPRHATGTCNRHQRRIARAIKRARHMGIFSFKHGFTVTDPFCPSGLFNDLLMDEDDEKIEEMADEKFDSMLTPEEEAQAEEVMEQLDEADYELITGLQEPEPLSEEQCKQILQEAASMGISQPLSVLESEEMNKFESRLHEELQAEIEADERAEATAEDDDEEPELIAPWEYKFWEPIRVGPLKILYEAEVDKPEAEEQQQVKIYVNLKNIESQAMTPDLDLDQMGYGDGEEIGQLDDYEEVEEVEEGDEQAQQEDENK